MKEIAGNIPGYSYGNKDVAASLITIKDLEQLKISAGFTEEDERYLRLAGEVLADQTEQIVYRVTVTGKQGVRAHRCPSKNCDNWNRVSDGARKMLKSCNVMARYSRPMRKRWWIRGDRSLVPSPIWRSGFLIPTDSRTTHTRPRLRSVLSNG